MAVTKYKSLNKPDECGCCRAKSGKRDNDGRCAYCGAPANYVRQRERPPQNANNELTNGRIYIDLKSGGAIVRYRVEQPLSLAVGDELIIHCRLE